MKTILKKEIRLTPADEKTNISVPFTLQSQADEMHINFSYSPKILEDEQRAAELIKKCLLHDTGEFINEYNDYSEYLPLKNLVTISVDSPNGYVGAAHRHNPNQTHILSENVSSVGFSAGKIVSGDWNVMINVHAVVTDYCDCVLEIEAEGEDYE